MKVPIRSLLLGSTLLLCGGLEAQQVQKCCGTNNSTFLLGNLSISSHSQCLYTPWDLTNAQDGNIGRIYYRYGSTGQANGNTLTNFMVRLAQTTDTAFTNLLFFTGLDTVYTAASHTIAPGSTGDWFMIELDQPFAYDASQTLVVDISFTGSQTTNFGTLSTSMTGRKLYWSDNTSPTGQMLVSSWQDIGFDLATSTGASDLPVPGFQVFPNPALGSVQVLLDMPATSGSSLALLDAAGRVLHQQGLVAGTNGAVLDLEGVTTGCYILRMNSPERGQVVERLVVL